MPKALKPSACDGWARPWTATPWVLYRYAENRADLLDGITELVLNELAIFPQDPDWQTQLRRIAHDLRLLALRHPNVVPLLVTRPLSTPLGLRPLGTLRPLEQILGMLVEAATSVSWRRFWRIMTARRSSIRESASFCPDSPSG